MKVAVQVKPRSKKESVTPQGDGSLLVRVNAPPAENLANLRVIELLAEHFQVPKSSVRLVSGGKSKRKMFEVK